MVETCCTAERNLPQSADSTTAGVGESPFAHWRSPWKLCRREQRCAVWEIKTVMCLTFCHMSFVPPAMTTLLLALAWVCKAASSSLSFTHTPPAELWRGSLHLTQHTLCSAAINNCDDKSQLTALRFFLHASNVLWQMLLSCFVGELRKHTQPNTSPEGRGRQVLRCSPYGGRRCLAVVFIKKKVLVGLWATAIVSISLFTDDQQECLDLP